MHVINLNAVTNRESIVKADTIFVQSNKNPHILFAAVGLRVLIMIKAENTAICLVGT
jgi:hypothetical protein